MDILLCSIFFITVWLCFGDLVVTRICNIYKTDAKQILLNLIWPLVLLYICLKDIIKMFRNDA